MLFIIAIWIIFCILVGKIGEDRNIGFGGAFLISLIFSPIIGFIVAICSSQKTVYYPPQTTTKIVQPDNNADQLLKYKQLFDQGVITQEEFEAQKRKLLS